MALRLPVPRLLPRLALPARAVAARRPARNFSGWGLAFTVAGRLAFRGRAARRAADLGLELDQQRLELPTTSGRVEVMVVRPRQEKLPAVLVNVGCYYTLADTLEKVEGPRYAAQGYGYVLWRALGPVEEVADRVFQRWRSDAAAVLDWLGQQSWCDGRVGCHGYSLLGNTSYATLAASLATDAPPHRPKVKVIIPAISFSRIQPTVFVWGQGLAAELALRFLWLAEVGLREGRSIGLGYLWGMFGFFGLPDWPGLRNALGARPVGAADVGLWGRKNELWQGGQSYRHDTDAFWRCRDRQFDFLSQERPHIHVIAGWNDMFLRQSLDDYVEASQSTVAQLTVFTGGHFGVVMNHAGEVAAETGRSYREHLAGESVGRKAPVRMQLIGDERQWLCCGAWPPPSGPSLQLHLSGEGQVGALTHHAAGAQLGYLYDPQDPTPYAGDGWLNLQKDGPQDQRGLESSREDLLVLSSEPLESDMDVVGRVQITLRLSCTAPECDVLGRLCVVRQQPPPLLAMDPKGLGPGKSVNLCENIARVKFPNQGETSLELSLGYTCCRFFAGDQVRLHVCSAAHPRWLRHPLQPHGEDWLLGSSQVGAPCTIQVHAGTLELPLRGPDVHLEP